MYKPIKGKVAVRVQAQSPLDEVFLIDSGMRRVAEGLGRLEAGDLRPGLYKVKFKSGETVSEKSILLNSPVTEINGPLLKLPTAVPIAASADIQPAQAPAPAARKNSRPASPANRPGGFALAPRAIQAQLPKKSVSPWKGKGSGFYFELRATGAKSPHRVLAAVSLVNEEDDEWRPAGEATKLSHRLDCPPGVYRLRVRLADVGDIQMSLPAIEGWRTLVYLPVRDAGLDEAMEVPDIGNAGILLSKTDATPDLAGEMVYWTEQARLALASCRPVAPKEEFRRLLQNDWNEPMYLLFGAHLLLLDDKRDWELLGGLIARLEQLIPGHPDVRLLSFFLKIQTSAQARFTDSIELPWPPMLAPSWRLLLNPVMRDRVVLPAGSASAAASMRQWGSSVWLLWAAPNKWRKRKPARELTTA